MHRENLSIEYQTNIMKFLESLSYVKDYNVYPLKLINEYYGTKFEIIFNTKEVREVRILYYIKSLIADFNKMYYTNYYVSFFIEENKLIIMIENN